MITDSEIGERYDFGTITQLSFLRHIRKLIEGQGWNYGIDHRIQRIYDGIEHRTPWVFVRKKHSLNCCRHHTVLFDCFEIIPQFCMNCYKVVIRPRTIAELFKLHDVMRDHLSESIKCKCGVEERSYVNALYGGYCYTEGLEEGQKVYEEVRRQVSKYISPFVPVLLKRACTEYKEMYGPADTWDSIEKTVTTNIARDAWPLVESWVDSRFIWADNSHDQPQDIKTYVMKNWVDFAYASGDKTYKVFTRGQDIKIKDTLFHKELTGEIQ